MFDVDLSSCTTQLVESVPFLCIILQFVDGPHSVNWEHSKVEGTNVLLKHTFWYLFFIFVVFIVIIKYFLPDHISCESQPCYPRGIPFFSFSLRDEEWYLVFFFLGMQSRIWSCLRVSGTIWMIPNLEIVSGKHPGIRSDN